MVHKVLRRATAAGSYAYELYTNEEILQGTPRMGRHLTWGSCLEDPVDTMEARDGILYRRWESDKSDRIVYQIVLPSSHTDTALQARHDHPTASHRGLQRTLHSLQLRYYWPGLKAQTYRWASRCTECAAKKKLPKKMSSTSPTKHCGVSYGNNCNGHHRALAKDSTC